MKWISLISEVGLGKVKTVLTIISIIIAIMASGFGLLERVRAVTLKNERDNALDELQVKTTEVVTYENELGQTVTKTLEYERYIGDLENSNDSLERKIYATVKASNLKRKQLKEAIAVSMEVKGSGQYNDVTMVPVKMESQSMDSVVVKHFNDGFLDATIYEDSLEYTYNDSIVLIKASRLEDRDFFLWRWIGWKKKVDRDMVEIVATNPRSRLNGRMIRIE